MSDPRRVRVRVTADPGPRRASAVTRGIALPDAPADEADAVFARALRRTQLRLALGTVSGFVIIVVALSVAIAAIPGLDDIVLLGVPLPWLLHAFAYYPVVLVFAVLYARGADRNERRYRALRERE